MKAALVISSLSLGGASRVMSLLANYWAERGDDIMLITLDTAAADAFSLDARVRRVALDMMQDSSGMFAALANNRRRLVAIHESIAASGADVVLSFEDRMNVLVVLATVGLGVRQVLCERTDVTRHRIGKLWPILRRLSYPLATALVVQTRALLPWAQSVMFSKRRVRVIPNPVLIERFAACNADSNRPLTIVSVGRLAPEKGYDVLLRAFAEVARDFPAWRLIIAGDGAERESLAALMRALNLDGQVRLAGYVPEPEEVLANASIFVMSSRYEGFPNALLEAMASGLAVISTACTGSVELITHGVNGMLVPVDSRSELADAMRQLMKDAGMRHQLGRNARSAAQRYSLDSVIKEWDALITRPCSLSFS